MADGRQVLNYASPRPARPLWLRVLTFLEHAAYVLAAVGAVLWVAGAILNGLQARH